MVGISQLVHRSAHVTPLQPCQPLSFPCPVLDTDSTLTTVLECSLSLLIPISPCPLVASLLFVSLAKPSSFFTKESSPPALRNQGTDIPFTRSPNEA